MMRDIITNKLKHVNYDNPKLYTNAGKLKKQFEFIDLAEYVKKEILRYTDDMKIPNHLVLRLKGLLEGKFICNNNTTQEANYTIESVKYTFMACKSKIHYALDTVPFNSESRKINYIFKIIEGNINTVFINLLQSKKQVDKMMVLSTDSLESNDVEYVKKERESKVSKKLKKFW